MGTYCRLRPESAVDKVMKLLYAVSESRRDLIASLIPNGTEILELYEILGLCFLRILLDIDCNMVPTIVKSEWSGNSSKVTLDRRGSDRRTIVRLEERDGSWQIIDICPATVRRQGLVQIQTNNIRLRAACIQRAIESLTPDLDEFINLLYVRWSRRKSAVLALGQTLIILKRASLFLTANDYDLADVTLNLKNCIFGAIHKVSARVIACKVLRDLQSSMRGNFAREVEILTTLRDKPYVINLLQSGNLEGLPYFICDWARGKPLDDEILNGKEWNTRQKLKILVNIVQSANNLRRSNVIHKDLAPDHIFVDDNLDIQLIDFGMAQFIDRRSPEKLLRDNAKEIRNLGIVMCCMLIPNPIIQFGSACDCLNAWSMSLDRLRSTTVSRDLIRIVERSVAADIECRSLTRLIRDPYSDLKDLLTDLEFAFNMN